MSIDHTCDMHPSDEQFVFLPNIAYEKRFRQGRRNTKAVLIAYTTKMVSLDEPLTPQQLSYFFGQKASSQTEKDMCAPVHATIDTTYVSTPSHNKSLAYNPRTKLLENI